MLPNKKLLTPCLSAQLKKHGLTEQNVLECFDVPSIAHVPFRNNLHPLSISLAPASVLPLLFVAGRTVPLGAGTSSMGGFIDTLLGAHLLETVDSRLRATVALFPVGDSLVMTDRIDTRPHAEIVEFPDDSTYHLLHCLPSKRVPRWLDVGTGCGLLPLAKPKLANQIVGTDFHARALDFAAAGISLTTNRHIHLACMDLLDGMKGQWDLITFNAPIPPEAGISEQSSTPYRNSNKRGLLEIFWKQALQMVSPNGEVLVHSWQSREHYPENLQLPGQAVALRYAEKTTSTNCFGITHWKPNTPKKALRIYIELTRDSPHLQRNQLEQSN